MSFTSNFAFMERHEPVLAELGASAEAYFTPDPNVSLFKLRQLAEQLAQVVAQRHRFWFGDDESQHQRIQSLLRRGYVEEYQAGLFHKIRRAGNEAVHQLSEQHGVAAKQLRNARGLCVWFESQFGNPDFRPGKFNLPPPPPDASIELQRAHAVQAELERQLAESLAARQAYEAQVAEQAHRLGQARVLFSTNFMAYWRQLDEGERDRLGPSLAAFRDAPAAVTLTALEGAEAAFQWLPLDGSDGAVVVSSPSGDVRLVVWVGSLLPGAAWASRKRVEVHPMLGSLQVYEPVVLEEVAGPTSLFDVFDDEELGLCGVPAVLLPAVRALADREALSAFARFLPAEAADTLFAIADGQAPADARREAGLRAPAGPVDVDDFEVAIAHQASRRSFAELDDPTFEEMLQAPLDAWRLFLHPSQSKVVAMRANGPVRVLGGAGTGKTVALLHRTAHLLREVLETDAQLLVTTYTRTMARELEQNLSRLLSDEEMERVSVSTLHQWCATFLRGRGERFSVLGEKGRKALWKTVVADHGDSDRPRSFYLEEWEQVVQAQAVQTRSDYFGARRQGRGTRLNRRGRAKVWKVFEAYRAGLDEAGKIEWADLIRRTREALEADPAAHSLRSVLVDEVQDFGQAELELLRALVPEAPYDLFLVGDAHQRIYQLGCSLSRCGIHVRGRAHRLKVNYRTTEAIQQFAMSVLTGVEVDDLDEGTDHLRGYHSLRLGEPPTVQLWPSREAEREAVVVRVRRWLEEGVAPAAIVVAARSGWLVGGYRKALAAAGVDVVDLDTRGGEMPDDAVRVSTMHRLKGTEFSRVLLAGVHAGSVPLEVRGLADAAAEEDHLKKERCLVYVAATRARDELVVMGAGDASSLLRP